MLKFGDLILCRYLNFHNDPAPMIFILKSDITYTEGLNSHYITKTEANYIRRLMLEFPDNVGNKVYYYLKNSNKSAINRAYRKYFTNLLVILQTWTVQATTTKEINALFQFTVDSIEKQHNIKAPDLKDKLLAAYKEEQRLAKNAKERERYWLNKANAATNNRDKDAFLAIAYERGTKLHSKHRQIQGIARTIEI
jgi:hypothetical protein